MRPSATVTLAGCPPSGTPSPPTWAGAGSAGRAGGAAHLLGLRPGPRPGLPGASPARRQPVRHGGSFPPGPTGDRGPHGAAADAGPGGRARAQGGPVGGVPGGRGAGDPGPPVPHRGGPGPRAAGRPGRVGRAAQRRRRGGRLRRGVPLRPGTGRGRPGPGARARDLRRLGEQDPGPGPSARLAGPPRWAHRRRGRGEGPGRPCLSRSGAAGVRRPPGPGRGRPAPPAQPDAVSRSSGRPGVRACHPPPRRDGGRGRGRLHAVAELAPEADEAAVVAAARERSVGVYGMADHRFPGSSGPAALVLGYGGLGERAIEAGVRLLALAVSRSAGGWQDAELPWDEGARLIPARPSRRR